MAELPKSPVFQFLIQKENLPAVLEVVGYAEDIRDYVADRFWNTLEEAIKKNPVSASFSWERKLPDKSDGSFQLFARPQGLTEEGQGLKYMIETNPEYFGMGLAWNEDAHRQFDKLCQVQSVKALQAVLRKRPAEGVESEPSRWWLWWETWQRNPYTNPWSWFGSDFGQEWFDDVANKFWDFVLPTHQRVLEVNKDLARLRQKI